MYWCTDRSLDILGFNPLVLNYLNNPHNRIWLAISSIEYLITSQNKDMPNAVESTSWYNILLTICVASAAVIYYFFVTRQGLSSTTLNEDNAQDAGANQNIKQKSEAKDIDDSDEVKSNQKEKSEVISINTSTASTVNHDSKSSISTDGESSVLNHTVSTIGRRPMWLDQTSIDENDTPLQRKMKQNRATLQRHLKHKREIEDLRKELCDESNTVEIARLYMTIIKKEEAYDLTFEKQRVESIVREHGEEHSPHTSECPICLEDIPFVSYNTMVAFAVAVVVCAGNVTKVSKTKN